jgi:acetyl-CoA carboxylase biotin carboxyl carrier protein
MTLDLEQLKNILGLVREHDLAEFEIEQDGLRLKIRKNGTASAFVGGGLVSSGIQAPADAPTFPSTAPASPASPTVAAGTPVQSMESDIELEVVKSPIVGTFYRSAEPGAPPFVEVGGSVKKGQVLCIIEAMKLMNEIDSEYDGEIVNVYVENGQPVQYGERLFAIRTK